MSRPRLDEDRPCTVCEKTAPEVKFGRQSTGTRKSECQTCYKERYKEAGNEAKKRHRNKIRIACFTHYCNGRMRCQCEGCDVTEVEFLSIDHINGGGNNHRKEIGIGGGSLYRWLIKNKFPEGFRVLCMNCNFALGSRGYCPHERIKADAVETL